MPATVFAPEPTTSSHLYDPRSSWKRATKFREHLSAISTASTAFNLDNEISRFSPDTPSPAMSEEHPPRAPSPPESIASTRVSTPVPSASAVARKSKVLPSEPISRPESVASTRVATPIPHHSDTDTGPKPSMMNLNVHVHQHGLPERDVEQGPAPRSPQSSIATSRSWMHRLSRLFHGSWRGRKHEMPPDEFKDLYPNEPFPPVHLEPWTALHIQNKKKKDKKEKQRKRRKWIIIVLIILLLYLFGNVIALNIQVSQLRGTTTFIMNGGTNANTSTSTQLSSDAQTCLQQFRLNAPSSPDIYPCSTCVPAFAGIPSDFKSPTDNDAATDISNAFQFCALKSVFDSAGNDTAGGNALAKAGWVQNIRFCTWAGVTCGGDGKVSQLELDAPALPTTLPSELANLSGLQSLRITGDGQLPGGQIPASFSQLGALQVLQLQSTGLTGPLPDMFNSMKSLTQLTLGLNTQMSVSLPPSLFSIPLKALTINSQPLSTSLNSLVQSSTSSSKFTSSLQVLSLTNTSLSGSIPILPFSSLSTLRLGSNHGLTTPLPGSFPPNLALVDLSDDPGFKQTSVPSAFCGSQVTTCTLTGSGFVNPCGKCTV